MKLHRHTIICNRQTAGDHALMDFGLEQRVRLQVSWSDAAHGDVAGLAVRTCYRRL